MNGMLHHNDSYREGVDRHQAEAQQWARDGSMGRLAQAAAKKPSEPGRRARIQSLVVPMKALLVSIGHHTPKRAHRHI